MTVIAVNAMILEGDGLSGIGHYIVRLLSGFSRLNAEAGMPHRILALCRDTAAHHLAELPGVEVVTAEIGSGRVVRVLFEQFHMPLMLRRARVDILLNPAFTGPLWGAPRIVTTVHDLYFRTIPMFVPRGQRLFLSVLVPRCCRRSWRVIVPSAATGHDLTHFYPKLEHRIVVIPLANRLSGRIASNDPDEVTEPFVLLVAALTGNKNPEPLVAAVATLRQQHPALSILHIGKDPEGHLAKAVAKHGAEAWVHSRTGVQDDELAAAYQTCLCFVIPSLYEGFGLPLLEAQSLGAPVVSSNRGALPEVGGTGAIYVDPAQAGQIADAIKTLIRSPERRRALRQAGFANQARFSWERTAGMTWKLLLDGFALPLPDMETA